MNKRRQILDQAIIAAGLRRVQAISKLKDPRYTFMQKLIKEPSAEEVIQYLCDQMNGEIKEKNNGI